MAVIARPGVMCVTGDIIADTKTNKGPGKWYWIMDDQYDKLKTFESMDL
jgi:hypothetical protein